MYPARDGSPGGKDLRRAPFRAEAEPRPRQAEEAPAQGGLTDRSGALRIVYAGTPSFAVPALQALVRAGHEIPLVLTQPDRPAGRGMRLRQSAVSEAAQALGLRVEKPASLKLPAAPPLIEATACDVMVVAAFGQILPEAILAIPRLGCLNIHASLLPRWRGAAPIHRAILAGDPTTGVTIMLMDAGLDTGPMLLRCERPLTAADTTGKVTDDLAHLGAEALLEVLARQAPWAAEPQDGSHATYAAKIAKDEARLDWTRPAAELERQVRAFDPAPGAEASIGGESLKVWRAELAEGAGRAGEIVGGKAGDLVIACGSGALRLLEVQRPGARRVSARDYLRARETASR